jgi:hypothetical protein
MARAPPASDSDPDLIEFGIPVLDDRLAETDLEFPASRNEVEATLGPIEVPYDAAGHTVTVSAALGHLDQEEFESKHELLDALHPVFEARRQRASSGLLATLRSVLPF